MKEEECGRRESNPGRGLGRLEILRVNPLNISSKYYNFSTVNVDDVKKYFSLREINRISKKWLKKSKQFISEYLDYMNWNINENQIV